MCSTMCNPTTSIAKHAQWVKSCTAPLLHKKSKYRHTGSPLLCYIGANILAIAVEFSVNKVPMVITLAKPIQLLFISKRSKQDKPLGYLMKASGLYIHEHYLKCIFIFPNMSQDVKIINLVVITNCVILKCMERQNLFFF